ncbi:MAG: hypothetical protein HXX19_09680 [Rhodoferax sp.]|nr:hypothetical protein [Rhodoferax sp.]
MTTTTLLRELPAELEVLLWSGQLRKISFNEFSALKLLSNAVCNIRNARTPEFNALARFFMANEGIQSLCLGVTYMHGVLPTGLVGHRSMVVQVGCEMLHLPLPIRDQILYACAHQELITYGSTEPVEEADALHLVTLGDKAVEQARYVYPDWFL